ncbi:MAG: glycosyltransferase [Acidobacteria bacterium]|nr:glycosyltransferase [Acidobacteriota bacterium]
MINPAQPDYSNTPASPDRAAYPYAPERLPEVPAVTLITPFFNEGEVFRETVASVRRQSLQNFEWIIVDDCSSRPGSLALLVEVAQDPRVRVVRAESNGGPARARNLAASLAKAPFLAFVDSDDLLEPTALEKWRWFLEAHPQYGLVKGFQVGFGAQNYLWTDGFHSAGAVLERNPIQTASMIRREVWELAGGMDEEIRGGMEDWDFWLRCASKGWWGGTVPEYLDWYRRRASHQDRWSDWDDSGRQAAFLAQLREKYVEVFEHGIPVPPQSYVMPNPVLPLGMPFANPLAPAPPGKRLLILVPHLELGGSDKFTLDLIGQLSRRHSFHITVAATSRAQHTWRCQYEELTPDVFTLETFLKLSDYPRFLAYLVESRSIDTVLVTHSQFAYQLLPYLRTRFPHLRCLDYIHIEEEHWKNGGYPRFAINYKNFLDATVASSEHLRNWVVERGADAQKVQVCYTNIDTSSWDPSAYDKASLRACYGVEPGVPVISFAGRLCDQKQPNILLATLLGLRDRGYQFVALVAGDGEDGPALRAGVQDARLTQVRLLGSRSNDEIRGILSISDIFFLPSKMEGIALSMFEAMAMGAVPVGADVGGQRELVTPETGILIRRGGDEAAAYVEAISGLLLDAQRRAAMSKAARRRVAEAFDLDAMGDRMAAILAALPASPADVASMFLRSSALLATECVEQRRLEILADDLWSQRPQASPGFPDSPLPDSPRPVQWDELVPLLASAVRGSLAAWWKLSRLRGSSPFAALRCSLLASFARGAARRNLRLLGDVLAHPGAAEIVASSFDQGYYFRHNSDVARAGIDPLLHYSLFGHAEHRRPSESFDLAPCFRRWPELRRNGVNPLLWKAVHDGGLSRPSGR